jgi:hypothetical protein
MAYRSRDEPPPPLVEQIAQLRSSAKEKEKKAIAEGILQPGDLDRLVETARKRKPAELREIERQSARLEDAEEALSLLQKSHTKLHDVYGELGHEVGEPCSSAAPTVQEHNVACLHAMVAASKWALRSEPTRALVQDRNEAIEFMYVRLGLSHREIAALTLQGRNDVAPEDEDPEELNKAEGASRTALWTQRNIPCTCQIHAQKKSTT